MNIKKLIVLLTIISCLIGCAAMIGPIMSNVEKPKYKIVSRDGSIEIRDYKPLIIAEVRSMGPRKSSISTGFRTLADYIFGNNASGQEIAMTAPVQQKGGNTEWRISFVMPSKFSLQTLPKPINQNINLKRIPGKRYAVIRFSGNASDENIQSNEAELMKYISHQQLSATTPVIYAFYNPPWTLPFMKRNEVLAELR
ncbi:MAG: SOUL heme-binding protein [Rhodospirillaceae bacterium]|nr:SOUL heme-binding protein [Rhodospirillaceae bacterium]|tara:strand:- start:3074 stop:3664 length:591 start_codon:yes stop_codon:yes gene_type:complete